MISGRGYSSSLDGGSTEAVLREESISSTTHYYSAAAAPGLVFAVVELQ
jgi:hypothetical protein